MKRDGQSRKWFSGLTKLEALVKDGEEIKEKVHSSGKAHMELTPEERNIWRDFWETKSRQNPRIKERQEISYHSKRIWVSNHRGYEELSHLDSSILFARLPEPNPPFMWSRKICEDKIPNVQRTKIKLPLTRIRFFFFFSEVYMAVWDVERQQDHLWGQLSKGLVGEKTKSSNLVLFSDGCPNM